MKGMNDLDESKIQTIVQQASSAQLYIPPNYKPQRINPHSISEKKKKEHVLVHYQVPIT